jgi:cell fate regulator YaaT (PSP1 superfamily)
MVEVVGIRFKRVGRVYYFDPAGVELEVGNWVVVETARGMEAGWVVIAPKQVLASELAEPLKPVLRKAEVEELRQMEEFRSREQEALATCEAKVAQFNLPMKLLSAEHNLDGSRLTFYFTAVGRVDFRELVRDLAATFKTRVELRQVGPRDEAKMMGGFGPCGRPLCCSSFLCEFNPVSIRMAKEQDVPLSPAKISGVCGRLLCCLSHESEQYREMKEKLPQVGQRVYTSLGEATVVGCNPLKETVMIQLESEVVVELPLAEVAGEGNSAQQEGRGKRRS